MSEEEKKLEPKLPKYKIIKDIVTHCPFCGEEWNETDDTNKEILCSCGTSMIVIKL